MMEYNIKKIGVSVWQFIVNNKIVFYLTSIAVLNVLVSYFYIGYKHGLIKGDAITYFYAIKFLQGVQNIGPEIINRVLTVPLFLHFSIFASYFLKDINLSISIVNLIFYFLCVYSFYFLAKEIYKENKIALLGTILFSFNYYVIDPVNAHIADMGGWFFLIFSTYLAIKYFNTTNKKFYYLSILFSAVGVLFKEYGGFGILNLAILISVSNISIKKKVKDIITAGSIFLVPILSYHIFVYLKYHYSYFDWFTYVKTISSVSGYKAKGFVLLVKILGWLFSFGWLAFLFGIWEEWKVKDKIRLKILFAILPTTLTFYIWPAITQRLAVMFMMWLALIAGFGLSKMKWFWVCTFLLIYVLFNYNINFLIGIINLPF